MKLIPASKMTLVFRRMNELHHESISSSTLKTEAGIALYFDYNKNMAVVEPNEIFTKTTEQQKRALIEALVKGRNEVLCKTDTDEMLTLHVHKWERDRYLICAPATRVKFESKEIVIVSFTVNNDKYFIKSTIEPSLDGKWWKIDGAADLFKLQRRQAYRIRIPPGYKSKATLKNSQSEVVVAVGELIDISSGGCKISYKGAYRFKSGENISLEVRVGRREPLDLFGEIRHVQDKGNQAYVLGVMFKSINSVIESKLFAVTLELHRELAGKVAG